MRCLRSFPWRVRLNGRRMSLLLVPWLEDSVVECFPWLFQAIRKRWKTCKMMRRTLMIPDIFSRVTHTEKFSSVTHLFLLALLVCGDGREMCLHDVCSGRPLGMGPKPWLRDTTFQRQPKHHRMEEMQRVGAFGTA